MSTSTKPSFVARATAFCTDIVLLAAVHFVLLALLASEIINSIRFDGQVLLFAGSFYLVVFAASFFFLHMAYFVLCHAWSGQTVGKALMGMKVVTCEGEPLSPGVAFLRWSGYILSLVPLAAGFLWAAVDKDLCAWHDRLARTMVVTAEMT